MAIVEPLERTAPAAVGPEWTDRAGCHGALTVFTAMPWWWRQWLRVNYRLFKAFAWMLRVDLSKGRSPLRGLKALAFISFAQWGVFGRSRPGGGEKLRRRYILFETNYTGDFEQYIQAFSYVLTPGVQAMWQGAYGVPHPKPLWPFLRYIYDHWTHAAHYYSAYPEGSVKTIRVAGDLKKRFDRFQAESRGRTPEHFSVLYDEFLADVQRFI